MKNYQMITIFVFLKSVTLCIGGTMLKSTRLHLDLESFSEVDLKACGVYCYAAHESTEILVMCYAFGDEPVQTWLPGEPFPERVAGHITAGGIVAAFNAQFERVVLNGVAGEKIGCPKISIEQTHCVMAKARVSGLPGNLGGAAEALGTHAKAASGAMKQLSKPRRGKVSRYTPENSPEKFKQLYSYCRDDVRAECGIDLVVPDLTERELEIYRLDQRINDRGWLIDRASINNALFLVTEYKKRLVDICVELTGLKPTQSAKLADWVRENGYPQLANLQSPTVAEALADPGCPKEVRTVLKCYSTHNMKAVSKFTSMLKAAGEDDRLRGMFVYYGAGPGRWSSRIVQLQNVARPVIGDPNTAIKAIRQRDLDWLRWLYSGTDAMKVLSSCVRGMLVAPRGRRVAAFDFSQIESRIQAWLAGAEWKLQVFREGKVKIYNVTGAMMFGIKPSEVVDSGEDQLYTAAKIGELACGYQGWAAAIEKFARQMGITLKMPAEDIASRWREANTEQVKLWADLEEAARHAVLRPGCAFGIPNRKITFKVIGRWLYMRLPSGRRLAYLDPELEKVPGRIVGLDNDDGTPKKVKVDGGVTYMGVNTVTRRWERVQTYGGKLLQNACEGIGRDLLASGLLNMEAAGYETIGSVHDEGVFEIDDDFGSEEEAMRLMTIPLKWAEGLPVKATGYIAKRYRK